MNDILVSRSEEWAQVAELDEKDGIRFTAEFRRIMGELGREGKAFIGHLPGLWFDPFEHMNEFARRIEDTKEGNRYLYGCVDT